MQSVLCHIFKGGFFTTSKNKESGIFKETKYEITVITSS